MPTARTQRSRFHCKRNVDYMALNLPELYHLDYHVWENVRGLARVPNSMKCLRWQPLTLYCNFICVMSDVE